MKLIILWGITLERFWVKIFLWSINDYHGNAIHCFNVSKMSGEEGLNFWDKILSTSQSFTDDQRTDKDDADDLAPKLTLIRWWQCLGDDVYDLPQCWHKLIDSYRRQNDVTQASSLASYPTQNGDDDYLVGDDYEVDDRRRHDLIDQKALSIWQILTIIIATSRLNIVPSGSFREFWSNQSEKFVRSLVMLRTLV